MNSLHQILLDPTDVLFFRDGRPMGGSLAGHSAAWPLPDVTNHALHAALHRAGLESVHEHRRGRGGVYSEERDRKFGSLQTAGPFPVLGESTWYFPRPRDAQSSGTVAITLHPVSCLGGVNASGASFDQTQSQGESNSAEPVDPWLDSSLPDPLEYAVGSVVAPSKDAGGEPWISRAAFESYLRGETVGPDRNENAFLSDNQIADIEHRIGIAIDSETQTTGQGDAEGKIYSAHFLRLRNEFRLGLMASANDKDHGDLLGSLLGDESRHIIVGGEQRVCSATRKAAPDPLPFPRGLTGPEDFRTLPNGKYAVKWVLLSAAIWPEMPDKSKDGASINPHPGGWLPNWIEPDTGRVLLKSRSGQIRRSSSGERTRRTAEVESEIDAHLVAAIVGKPLPVTGWALPNGLDRDQGGAKSTQFAAPAGSVYYFECLTLEAAQKLAAALNWHGGESHPTRIMNRRSTLLGEKGFGLGVCGTWNFAGSSPDV